MTVMMKCNLKLKVPGAPNFTYGEFVDSYYADRLNINNVPTSEQWANLEKLAIYVLQPIRNKFGRIKITSGFRSEELNTAIGGSPYSNHCKGEAADIIPMEEEITLLDVIAFVHSNLEYREMIYEWGKWIHVAYREDGNTRVLKIKDKTHDYKRVSLDYLFEYDRKLRMREVD
jgi:hypothetical protein